MEIETGKLAAVNLEECLWVNAAASGCEAVGKTQALQAWRWLMNTSSFKSVVLQRPDDERVLAFAASMFVSDLFFDTEVGRPTPGLNGRIISSIKAGRAVALNDSQLRRANRQDGLSEVILYSTWKREIVEPEVTNAIERLFARSFYELHIGYRLKRLLFEATDKVDIEHAASTKIWRVVSNFADFKSTNDRHGLNPERALFLADKAELRGSVGAFLFDYREPIFRFSKADQRMLAVALEGLTNDEIAKFMEISLQAVKKRWASVFDAVETVKPGLLMDSANHSERVTRGLQKRHKILAYLRQHPEEVRPH